MILMSVYENPQRILTESIKVINLLASEFFDQTEGLNCNVATGAFSKQKIYPFFIP